LKHCERVGNFRFVNVEKYGTNSLVAFLLREEGSSRDAGLEIEPSAR
jgi:hypothetical protein